MKRSDVESKIVFSVLVIVLKRHNMNVEYLANAYLLGIDLS